MTAGDRQRPPSRLARRDVLRRGAIAAGAVALGSRLALPTGLRGRPAPVDLGPLQPIAVQVPPPPVITRAEWGADEGIGDRTRNFARIRKAIVHHTAVHSPDPWTDPAGQMRAIQRAHVGQGWSDIGYHFAVDPAGRVPTKVGGRAMYVPGEVHTVEDGAGRLVIAAHAENHNTGSLGVVLLGTFTSRFPTPAALESLAWVIAWKLGPTTIDPYGADPYTRVSDGVTVAFANICGHRDVKATSCPGQSLYSWLPELKNRVAAMLARSLVGHRVLGADGSLWNHGVPDHFVGAYDIGDVRRSVRPGIPVRTAAGTPSGGGVWVADSVGGLYCFGDAGFHGSLGSVRLNQPIVGMAATPSGRGYWLVASDGGVFCFGDAGFHGSTGGIRLNQPIVGMAATPSGRGYWLVASDGGVFCFGDAGFHGSTGGIRLNQPIVGLAATLDGRGYWLVARDGGVFCFGNAPFHGSGVGRWGFSGSAVSLVASPTGAGYWLLDEAGNIHTCGAAPTFGHGVGPGAAPARALVAVVRA